MRTWTRLALVDPRALRALRESGLFDPGWYLTRNPDVRAHGASAARHYLAFGSQEGRDPNPCLSLRWYLSNNPDVAAAGAEPLLHYARTGEAEGRAPSPAFDPRWYAGRYADVGEPGAGLLRHYLRHGRAEGRSGAPAAEADPGEPVADAWLQALKPLEPRPGARYALLICHAAGCRLKPHVEPYARLLDEAGYRVVLVAMADGLVAFDPALAPALSGLYVRENRGLDFAAWAHLLREAPGLFAAGALVLANDSVLPRPAELLQALARVDASPADLVGLTDSYEAEWHVQSYLMRLNPRALGSIAFQRFMFDVTMLAAKDRVIGAYELRLASTLRAAGLRCEALFPAPAGDRANPTVRRWRPLLAEGLPVVKLSILQGREPEVDMAGAEGVLEAAGFDPDLLRRLAAPPVPAGEGRTPEPGAGPRSPGRLRVEYLGGWAYDDPAGRAARALIPALWRLGVALNLRPLSRPGRRLAPALAVVDFDGPADVALLDLHAAAARPLDAADARRLARAGRRVGVNATADVPAPAGVDAVCPAADAAVPARLEAWLAGALAAGPPAGAAA